MFKKILIANRGEIACRIIKTARRMGIATVAVYSDADAQTPHVRMADEAVRLGPPPAGESYLLADAILEACLRTGAQAVHPGYGFLSERASFCEMLARENITFIGPPASAMAAMGDKIESKKLAKAAGVPLAPGFIGAVTGTDHALQIAAEIGYPVMMKASAGGGGKGMRLAHSDAELREGFDSVRREAQSSFGDDRMLIERFITDPRHIEIQVLGDQHGNMIYLHERNCSVQRRNQKVVEEAPSPHMSPELRARMGECAVALARAVDYYSAGTMEFMVGSDDNFYFLEMNTRLQVEHPVTEAITGLDLVEQMLRVAAGEPLGIKQEDVRLDGWAVETRIYAEDPYRNFLPSVGRLSEYVPPVEEEGAVRIDTGVCEGSEISLFYDPMIAKLIGVGKTREEAIERNLEALDRYVISGIKTNIDFLSAVLQNPDFQSGHFSTDFIPKHFSDGFHGMPALPEDDRLLTALALVLDAIHLRRAAHIDHRITPVSLPSAYDRVLLMDGARHDGHVTPHDDGAMVVLGDETFEIETSWRPGTPLCRARVNGRVIAVHVTWLNGGVDMILTRRGRARHVRALSPRGADLSAFMLEKPEADLSAYLRCPMPGVVTALHVQEGDHVVAGQSLAVVEAMKMENILHAPKNAVVKKLHAKVGDTLAIDAVILEFEKNGK